LHNNNDSLTLNITHPPKEISTAVHDYIAIYNEEIRPYVGVYAPELGDYSDFLNFQGKTTNLYGTLLSNKYF
jgi:hypothetical protein